MEMLVAAVNPDGTLIGSGSSPVTVSGNVTAVPLAGSSAVSNAAPVTSPGAVATIAAVASGSLPAGTYSVTVTAGAGGTTAAGDIGNMTLSTGTITTRLANPNTGAVGFFGPFQFALNGSQALTVASVAAGNAGSVYSATIVATRVI